MENSNRKFVRHTGELCHTSIPLEFVRHSGELCHTSIPLEFVRHSGELCHTSIPLGVVPIKSAILFEMCEFDHYHKFRHIYYCLGFIAMYRCCQS